MRRYSRLLVAWCCLFGAPCALVADEAPVEEEAVVVDDSGVAQEDSAGDAADLLAPTAIEPREIDGRTVYLRQTSEAFVDPDARMSLVPKYFFVLDNADNGKPSPPSWLATTFETENGANVELTSLVKRLHQFAFDSTPTAIGIEPRWLDGNSAKPKLLAVLDAFDDSRSSAPEQRSKSLYVVNTKSSNKAIVLRKIVARREMVDVVPTMPSINQRQSMATWDFPKALASKAMFLGRVIAVLKRVEGRYCVDFYGQNLNPEADCRVWLPALGQDATPSGIEFVEIPIRKESGNIADVSVLAISYYGLDKPTRIAIDFPVCRPAVMAQMAQLQPKDSQQSEAKLDLKKLLGEDLLDEFARRLVDGEYK